MGDGLKPAFQPLTKHPKSMSVRVGILGASDRPDRYAYLAALELMDHGFDILPINPTKEEILGKPVLKSLLDTDLALHTLTIYVQPSRLKEHLEVNYFSRTYNFIIYLMIIYQFIRIYSN